jgi:hypothetical protein
MAVMIHALGNDSDHEELAAHVLTQGHAGFAKKVGEQDARVALIGLAVGIENGNRLMRKSGQFLRAES